MRKKITIIIIIVLSIVLAKLWLKNTLNNRFIKEYKKNSYSSIYLDLNSFINIHEPYIVHYNYGNYYYKTSKYEEAFEKYLETLKHSIPKDRLCKVKINTSLSLVMQVDKKNNREEQNELLRNARSFLDEGCGIEAPKEDQDTAEKLRKLIDELLNSEGAINNKPNNNEEEQNDKDDPLNDPMETIKRNNDEATKKRDKNMEENNNMDNYSGYCQTDCW